MPDSASCCWNVFASCDKELMKVMNSFNGSSRSWRSTRSPDDDGWKDGRTSRQGRAPTQRTYAWHDERSVVSLLHSKLLLLLCVFVCACVPVWEFSKTCTGFIPFLCLPRCGCGWNGHPDHRVHVNWSFLVFYWLRSSYTRKKELAVCQTYQLLFCLTNSQKYQHSTLTKLVCVS